LVLISYFNLGLLEKISEDHAYIFYVFVPRHTKWPKLNQLDW